MGNPYLPLAILLFLAISIAGVMLIMSFVFGPRRPDEEKLSVYECGINPTRDSRARFSIKFFIIAILFILFDIEVIFLYPWAILYQKLGLFGLVEMTVFIVILLLGYIYLWRKGAFEWE
ncbi:NADH-quinone oxidoreductase subunit A [candidate division CSSED10-310 bacterium]|uniref:NADH-quinone oxidoreductase subunit A n=1 Tax=candidate division CSSED10-310 bacterium TaxID=2855610 RepID=A0ABV6Z2L0_UNCC1